MDFLSLVALGVTAFAATNVDDLLLLTMFFGDRRFRARHVFIGQALGIGILVLISLAGAALALALPERWIGLLGLVPIALGVRELIARRDGADESPQPELRLAPATNGWQRAAAVAAVTVANGGDNIGVYAPLFAGRPAAQVALLLAVFGVMLAVWLFAAHYLARRSAVAPGIHRAATKLVPYILIGLGTLILAEAFLLSMLY